MKLKELLSIGRQKLEQQDCAALEAEILMASALDVSRSFLYANPDQILPWARKDAFLDLISRRQKGEPIAYLTGIREFWSLQLRVTPDVLIPRPETEGLVELALTKIPPGSARRIADLGTGSGAVALAIAHERPVCKIHATDLSEAALSVARTNAATLGLSRVVFHQGDWLSPLQGQFDVLVSNPPYVASGDAHLSQGDCRFEPGMALCSGTNGLDAIRQIVVSAAAALAPGGWLFLEHGFEQGTAVRNLLQANGFEALVTQKDLAGHERISGGRIQET